MERQSIDSAPKDGSFILAFRSNMSPVVVRWSDKLKGWRLDDTASHALGVLTHWMPVPAGPVYNDVKAA